MAALCRSMVCKISLQTINLMIYIYFPKYIESQLYNATANLSTSWKNNVTDEISFDDGSVLFPILNRNLVFNSKNSSAFPYAANFTCGFFRNGTSDSDAYLFAILIIPITYNGTSISLSSPRRQLVWSVNRDSPVGKNSTVQLTLDGNLVLQDSDGTIVWSTNTGNKSVVGLNLTETGNLVLYDASNASVWESFDHPTDTLLLGQKLFLGQKLTSSGSETNWSSGSFHFTASTEGLFAFIDSNPPQLYYQLRFSGSRKINKPSYVELTETSLAAYSFDSPNDPNELISIPQSYPKPSLQFMKLGADGNLRVFYFIDYHYWREEGLITSFSDNCGNPMVCGEYGICYNGQCSCPAARYGTSFFRETSERQPNQGCSPTFSLNCEASRDHWFLELQNITYFDLTPPDFQHINVQDCKQVCLQKCSCKAALFRYVSNSSDGECFLKSQIFSLMNNKQSSGYESSAFLKVGVPAQGKYTSTALTVVGASVGGIVALFVLLYVIFVCIFYRKRRNNYSQDDEEEELNQVTGLPTRFCFEELKTATQDFSTKLGQGGFGSVYEGALLDGTKVAVKRLDGSGQIRKSFLAEVETIGRIHHVNLVRLVGFCAEKSCRLLVYEFMSSGSLDKWIFNTSQECTLDWQQRKKIIVNVAKGLAYLHEDCRQKIIHLDIKPQNILLDENFNARVSDFGLSKLLDKDQSLVLTGMRGTPGYLAPEWISSMITEKVDVYSYGVVVLEILCGRKNLDRSQNEDEVHLLSLFKKKAEEELLQDLVDNSNEDMHLHREEVVEMMKVAAWCIQTEFAKRPSMSLVVKALERAMTADQVLDFDFLEGLQTSDFVNDEEMVCDPSTALLASVLSAPR